MIKIFSNNSGFTLLEVLLSLALFTIVASLALIMNLQDYRAYLFRSERDLIITSLQTARSQAVSNLCLGPCSHGQAHGVHFQNGEYVIFQGMVYSPAGAFNQEISGNSNISVNPSSAEVEFDQLSGNVDAAPWSLEIKDNFGRDVVISVNNQGRIEW